MPCHAHAMYRLINESSLSSNNIDNQFVSFDDLYQRQQIFISKVMQKSNCDEKFFILMMKAKDEIDDDEDTQYIYCETVS